MTAPALQRGTPDYGVTPYQTAIQPTDASEIASRLIGTASADGRGRVVFFDHFANGLGAFSATAGVSGRIPYLAYGYPVFIPPVSAVMEAGATLNSFSQIGSTLQLGEDRRIGVEVSAFYPTTALTTAVLQIQLAYKPTAYPGGNAILRYNPGSGLLQIFNSGGGWTTIGTVEVAHQSWQTFKMVCDHALSQYVRVIVGNTVIELTDAMIVPGTPNGLVSFIAGNQVTTGGTTPNLRIGHIAITRDEP